MLVGHQPTLGRVAALLMTGQESDWTIRKGAVWWLEIDAPSGEALARLRALVGPDLA